MTSSPKRTCLITGASAGIGKAFAEVFAEKGWDLILTARRKDRLQEVAADLEKRFGTHSLVIPTDLNEAAAPDQLFEDITTHGVHVDAIINNAGYGVKGKFLDNPWYTHRDQIENMATAPLHLSYLFLPGMVEKGFGRIINVSSVSGIVPGSPGSTLYGGIKSLLIQFSETLHMEYARFGIHVCAVCPGFTWSEFHDVMKTRENMNTMPKIIWLKAEDVARQGYDGVMKGNPMVVNGWQYKLVTSIIKVLPRGLVRRMSGGTSKRARMQKNESRA